MISAEKLFRHVRAVTAATLSFASHVGLELRVILDLNEAKEPGIPDEIVSLAQSIHFCAEDLTNRIKAEGDNIDHAAFLVAIMSSHVLPMQAFKTQLIKSFTTLLQPSNLNSRAVRGISNLIMIYVNEHQRASAQAGVRFETGDDGVMFLVWEDGSGRITEIHMSESTFAGMMGEAADGANSPENGGPHPLVVTLRSLLQAVTENIGEIRKALSEHASSGSMRAAKQDVLDNFNAATSWLQETEDTSTALSRALGVEYADLSQLLGAGEELCSSIAELIPCLVTLMTSNALLMAKLKPLAAILRRYNRESFKYINYYKNAHAASEDPGEASNNLTLTPGAAQPATPLHAALGGPAARLVAKDTTGVFRRIDELQNRARR